MLTLMNQHTSEGDFDDFEIVKKHTGLDPFREGIVGLNHWLCLPVGWGYLKTLDGEVWAVRTR